MSLYEVFGQVEDTRQPSGLRHPLQSFLTMATLSIMSGYNSMQSMATFFDSNKEVFVQLFSLKHGVPGYTQIRTILQTLNYESLCSLFSEWAFEHVPLEKGDWVSGDGKALASTLTDSQSSKQNYIAMVSLFVQKLGVVLGTNRYENGKSGEGASLQELLYILEGKGVIITLDALHCQKKTVDIILKTGNDYCLQVKGNQPNLYHQIQENIEQNDPIDTYFKKEKNRGREENRLVEIYDDLTGIDAKWTGLKRIVHVHRFGYRPDKKKDDGKYEKHHYYILSQCIDNAQTVFWGIRGHWDIENRLHYVKDVVQNEDNCRINKGHIADHLSILKNVAINIFRINGFQSITKANIYFANKIDKMMELISPKNKYGIQRSD